MSKVLVLGAGMVSKPLVRYLLSSPGFYVKVASRTMSKADEIINNHDKGEAVELNVKKQGEKLERLVSDSDVVVSLLPYVFHVKVAELCVKHFKHMVTTSYVSSEMQNLDERCKNRDVLILNECGLDPGIDHMSAMRIIHQVKRNEGKIVSFRSTTGALPSYEANNNPFGYKFSWSPRGVLLASKNPAKWLEKNKVISVPGEKLFENYELQDVPNIGTFENYPNRDSLKYKEIYGLKDAHTVYRGTFRMIGWCETLKALSDMGWLSEKPVENFHGKTYRDLTSYLINQGSNINHGSNNRKDVVVETADFLGVKNYSAVIKRLEWLGLFSDKKLPEDKNSPLDILNVLTLEKMKLGVNEKDMVIMHHEFIVEYTSKKEYITSTLCMHGSNGDTAVAKTVALPAAIAVKNIVEGKIKKRGILRPVIPEIYEPILNELESFNIKFNENRTIL